MRCKIKKYFWKKLSVSQKSPNRREGASNKFAHIFTFGDRHHIYDAYDYYLDNARQDVLIVNFLITHKELIETIIKTRQLKKIPVRVMTWLDKTQHLYVEEDDIYQLFRSQARSCRELAMNDIPLRSNTKCHVKMMLVDSETVIISSANLTDTSLFRNPENGILLYQMEEEVKIIKHFAKTLWRNYANTEIATLPPHVTSVFEDNEGEENLRVQSRPTNHDIDILKGICQETDNFRFLFTCPYFNTLHLFVLDMIERANREILLLSYKMQNIKQIGLFKVLKDKINQGVNVRILVCKKDTKILDLYGQLLDIGCEIEAIEYNHAKGIVIDQKDVMIMTANIDNYIMPHKESINIGIFFKNKEYSEQAKEFVNFLFDNRTHKLVKN